MPNYITRDIPDELKKALKHEAINQGRTLNDLILIILAKWAMKIIKNNPWHT